VAAVLVLSDLKLSYSIVMFVRLIIFRYADWQNRFFFTTLGIPAECLLKLLRLQTGGCQEPLKDVMNLDAMLTYFFLSCVLTSYLIT
jgi:hypothetical protein